MRYYNEPLSKYTTFKIGGPAVYLSICNTIEELPSAVCWAKSQGLPIFILGNGSNILVTDNGFSGLVIKLNGDFKKIVPNGKHVQVGSGVLLPSLSRYFMNMGWGGFEFMCDIPGTIGGAVRINAGTKQGEIKDNLISITVLTNKEEINTIDINEMDFSYRYSSLLGTNDIVLSATFCKIYDSDKADIQDKIKKIIASRRSKYPKIKQNCGSVFKSFPLEKPAGWYIEQAGLKGFRIGNAMIAHEHANWILNLGGARASAIKGIINHVQETVNRKFGVTLKREVIYVPEDLN